MLLSEVIAPFKACKTPAISPVSFSLPTLYPPHSGACNAGATPFRHIPPFFSSAVVLAVWSSASPQGRGQRQGHGSVLPAGHPAAEP